MKSNRTLAAALIAAALLAALPACDEKSDDPGTATPAAPSSTSNVRSLGILGPWGGAYPSDMVLGGTAGNLSRTLFVNDEATVDSAGGATVLAVDLLTPGFTNSTIYQSFNLQKTQLKKNNGSQVGASETFGAYFSDPTLDQILVVSDTAAFVLSSAGMGVDAAGTGFVAALTLFNPSTGAHVQTLNLGLSVDPGLRIRSDGSAPGASFPQSNPSGAAFVSTGAATGKVYVSMSNLYDWQWGAAPVYNPGTVQVFSVDFALGAPVTATPAATIWTSTFDPVHVTAYVSPSTSRSWVLASNAGLVYSTGLPYASLYITNSTIDVLNTQNETVRTTVDLGLAAVAFNGVAISRDRTGRTVGMIGSSFFGNAYAIDLSGLDSNPEDAAKVKALRSAYNPIQVFSNQGASHTWSCDVALSPSATWAFVAAYNQAEVHAVKCPDDWASGDFVSHPSDAPDALGFTALAGGTPSIGRLAAFDGAAGGPDLVVLQSNTPGIPANGGEYASIGAVITQGRMGE